MRISQTAVIAAGGAALALVLHQLRRWDDLTGFVVETIAAGLAAGVFYFVTLFPLEKTTDRRAAFWLILAAALVFRLQLLPLPPVLSDDLHRYRWEARMQAAGWNPYAVRPEDPRLAVLREEDWEKVSGRGISQHLPAAHRTGVPRCEAAGGGRAARTSLMLLKLPFLAADLAVMALLAWWIRTSSGRQRPQCSACGVRVESAAHGRVRRQRTSGSAGATRIAGVGASSGRDVIVFTQKVQRRSLSGSAPLGFLKCYLTPACSQAR